MIDRLIIWPSSKYVEILFLFFFCLPPSTFHQLTIHYINCLAYLFLTNNITVQVEFLIQMVWTWSCRQHDFPLPGICTSDAWEKKFSVVISPWPGKFQTSTMEKEKRKHFMWLLALILCQFSLLSPWEK